jgi:hypothetical protein
MSDKSQVTEKPIIFSGPMVCEIIASRKTQTRRIVKGRALSFLENDGFTPEFVALPENGLSPYGFVGQKLWVRESFWADRTTGKFAWYISDVVSVDPVRDDVIKKPAIHMPYAYRRLTLEIEGLRIERLQDISEDDAKAEGAGKLCFDEDDGKFHEIPGHGCYKTGFAGIWTGIHGADSWEANPWTWVISFRRMSGDEGKEGGG